MKPKPQSPKPFKPLQIPLPMKLAQQRAHEFYTLPSHKYEPGKK